MLLGKDVFAKSTLKNYCLHHEESEAPGSNCDSYIHSNTCFFLRFSSRLSVLQRPSSYSVLEWNMAPSWMLHWWSSFSWGFEYPLLWCFSWFKHPV